MTNEKVDKDASPKKIEAELANRDPITGAPGAHPVSVGIGGAVGGAAAGAAGGLAAGPVGAAIGAGVGAVLGGLAGKAIGEEVDPTVEDAYWRANYLVRSYVDTGVLYAEYQPAYRYGWEAAARHPDKTFDQVRPDLERGWERYRGESRLPWSTAESAVRDAWYRLVDRRSREAASRPRNAE